MKCNFHFHDYFRTFEKKCKDLNFVLIQIQDLNLELQKILLHSDLTNLHYSDSITKLSTFVQSAAVDAVSAAATTAASGCLLVQAAAAAAAGIPVSHVDSADAG
jgi:hypothetical protein